MEDAEKPEMQSNKAILTRSSLSPEQRSLLLLMTHGYSPDQIARRLDLTLSETQGALERLQELCRASSRRRLIALAILKGLV